jgi:hypothetical protein
VNLLQSAVRNFLPTSALLVIALAVPSLAHASFIGPYAVANWTVSAPVGGGVDLSGAPNTVTLTSSNSGTGGDVDFTITAVAAALWSFDWVYWTDDSDGPTYDPAGYLLNNTFFQLSPGSGHVDVAISAGDVIGFRANSSDGIFGSGHLAVSNFEAGQVPEPSTWALMGAGCAGLALSRLRRRRS